MSVGSRLSRSRERETTASEERGHARRKEDDGAALDRSVIRKPERALRRSPVRGRTDRGNVSFVPSRTRPPGRGALEVAPGPDVGEPDARVGPGFRCQNTEETRTNHNTIRRRISFNEPGSTSSLTTRTRERERAVVFRRRDEPTEKTTTKEMEDDTERRDRENSEFKVGGRAPRTCLLRYQTRGRRRRATRRRRCGRGFDVRRDDSTDERTAGNDETIQSLRRTRRASLDDRKTIAAAVHDRPKRRRWDDGDQKTNQPASRFGPN